MKLQEYHAKRLLLAEGLPVPDYEVAEAADGARRAAELFFGKGFGKRRDQGPGARRRSRQGRRREARCDTR